MTSRIGQAFLFFTLALFSWASSGLSYGNSFPMTFDSTRGQASSVDASGNLFWLSYFGLFAGQDSLRVNKYSDDGTLSWEKHYPIDQYLYYASVESLVDSNDDLILVSKTNDGGGHVDGVVLTKIANDGTLLWQHSRLGEGLGVTGASQKTLALDAWNNVYVLMRSNDNGSGANAIVEKYSVDGQLQWRKYFDSGAGDFPYQIEVSPSGVIFAHVKSMSIGSLLLQYDSAGNLLSQNIKFPPELLLETFAIGRFVLDSDGGIYLLGAKDSSSFLAKFKPDLALGWFKFEDIADQFIGDIDSFPLGLTGNGELIIAHPTPFFQSDITVKKYGRDGRIIAKKGFDKYGATGDARNDIGEYKIQILGNGEVSLITEILFHQSEGRGYWITDFFGSTATPGKEVFRIKDNEISSQGHGMQVSLVSGGNGHLYSTVSWETPRFLQYKTFIDRHK